MLRIEAELAGKPQQGDHMGEEKQGESGKGAMSIRGGYTAHLTPEDDLGFLSGVRSYESLSYPLDPFSAYICTVTSYLFLPVMAR